MLPDGAARFGGKNGEDMSVKFDQARVYGREGPAGMTQWARWL